LYATVGEYMLLYDKMKSKLYARREAHLSGGDASNEQTSAKGVLLNHDDITEYINKSMKAMITSKLTNKMLDLVDDLNVTIGPDGATIEHSTTGAKGVVEFVVYTMEVLLLDNNLTNEVSALKRILLGQVVVASTSCHLC